MHPALAPICVWEQHAVVVEEEGYVARMIVFFISGILAAAGLTAGITYLLVFLGLSSLQAFLLGAGAALLIVLFAGSLAFVLFPEEQSSEEETRLSLPKPEAYAQLPAHVKHTPAKKEAVTYEDRGKVIQLQSAQNRRVSYINSESQTESLTISSPIRNIQKHAPYSQERQNDSYAMPQGKRDQAVAVRSISSTDRLSTAEMIEEIHAYAVELVRLIQYSKERILAIENATHLHIHLFDSSFAASLMNSRRIVAALEYRIEKLKTYMLSPDPVNTRKAAELLRSDLVMPCDAMNAVLSAENIPSLPAERIQQELESILSSSENLIRQSGLVSAYGAKKSSLR